MKMFILLQLMKGNTCEKEAGMDRKYCTGNKCPDRFRWIRVNHDQKKHEMQNFPRHGRESGSFCFRLIKFVLNYLHLCKVTALTLQITEFAMIHCRNMENDLDRGMIQSREEKCELVSFFSFCFSQTQQALPRLKHRYSMCVLHHVCQLLC